MDKDLRGSSGSDVARQILNLLGIIALIGSSIYVVRSGAQFNQPEAAGDPPLVPASYAFSIWSVIYLGCVAYAIYQLLPSERTRPLFRTIGWWTALAFALTTSWLYLARTEDFVWITVIVLAAITVTLAVAQKGIQRAWPFDSMKDELMVRAPLSVYFGWCTAATFANVATALRDSGMTEPGNEVTATLVLLAGLVVVAGAAIMAARGNLWYAAAIVWALVAIVVANRTGETRPPNGTVATAGIAAVVIVVLATLVAWRRRKTLAPRSSRATGWATP